MELNGIVAFVRAAEEGGFAPAAKVLGMTASGVGKSISRLEAELGVRLLQRTTRRVTLTDDGALFFEHCRRILDELEGARNLISNRGRAPRGRLRGSMPMTLGKRWIIPQLARFNDKYPDVQLELSFSDRWVNLLEEGIDVAVRIGSLADSSLIARQIGSQQIVTVASRDYLGERRIAHIDELAQHRCLIFRQLSSGRDRPWRFLVDQRVVEVRPRAYMAIDDGEALAAAVCAGLGVTQLPSLMLHDALASGAVVEVLPRFRTVPEPINAVYASQKNLPARIRAFVEFLAGLPALDSDAAQPPAGVQRPKRNGVSSALLKKAIDRV